MKTHWVVIGLLFLVSLGNPPAPAGAEAQGGEILFEDTKDKPPVPFSHDKHFAAGNTCPDCHDSLFVQKAGTADKDNALTMASMKSGSYCGSCHNGEKAFSVKGNCKKCHAPAQLREQKRERKREHQ